MANLIITISGPPYFNPESGRFDLQAGFALDVPGEQWPGGVEVEFAASNQQMLQRIEATARADVESRGFIFGPGDRVKIFGGPV